MKFSKNILSALLVPALTLGGLANSAFAGGVLFIDGCTTGSNQTCGTFQYSTDSNGAVQAGSRTLYTSGVSGAYLTTNAAGALVATPNDNRNGRQYLYRFDQTTTGSNILASAAVHGFLESKGLAEDSAGNVFGTFFPGTDSGIFEVAAGTDAVSKFSSVNAYSYFAFDNSGNLFAGNGNTIHGISSGGADLGVFATDPIGNVGMKSFAFDAAGNLIGYNSSSGVLHEWGPTGTDLGTIATGIPSNGINGFGTMAVDGAGNVIFGPYNATNPIVYEYNATTHSVSTFDNISLNGMADAADAGAAPEPSTWVMALGMLALCGWMRRRAAARA